MDAIHEGRCHCGEVKFKAAGQSVLVEFCHCRSCRRLAGAPLMAWAAFEQDALAIVEGSPTAYGSSPGVMRTFCGRCGTPLTLSDQRFPEEVYVALASFDNPEALPPEFHIWRSHRLSWLETTDDLPRYTQFKSDGVVE